MGSRKAVRALDRGARPVRPSIANLFRQADAAFKQRSRVLDKQVGGAFKPKTTPKFR